MPINTPHPLHAAYSPRWKKCRDFYEGEETVKEAKTEYVPALSTHTGATDTKYLAYLARGNLLGAMQRTVEGLVGMATRKDYVMDAPDELKLYEYDVTNDGVYLWDFIKQIIRELLITSRVGVLVDHSGARAFAILFPAENIINWRYSGDGRLEMLVLAEVFYAPKADDPYVQVLTTRFREFYLDDAGYASTQVWKQAKTKTGQPVAYEKDGEATPLTRRGIPLDHIPFDFINPEGTGSDVVKPLLLDLVNTVASHFKNSVDYEHGLHFTALPTPWFSGISATNFNSEGKPGETVINIGCETAVLLPDPSASAGMLEFSGAGLGALAEAMENKKAYMAVLGARLLETQKAAAETAETSRINKSGDTSIMASLVGTVERFIATMLEEIAFWDDIAGEVSFSMNRDMLDSSIDPMLLTALIGGVQSGNISSETFVYNMKQGGLLGDGVTVDDELERLKSAAPRKVPGAFPLDFGG